MVNPVRDRLADRHVRPGQGGEATAQLGQKIGARTAGFAQADVDFGRLDALYVLVVPGSVLAWIVRLPSWKSGKNAVPIRVTAAPAPTSRVAATAKVVMLRNRLRTLEQHVNASDLPDDVKVKLRSYVSGCYGSLTSFNVFHSRVSRCHEEPRRPRSLFNQQNSCRRVRSRRPEGRGDHRAAYDLLDKSKSDLYVDALALINSGRIELLDHLRSIAQLASLENSTRRTR